jgi:antitoxin HigA-1
MSLESAVEFRGPSGSHADRTAVTPTTALILARVFGTVPTFRLNVQRRSDVWEAMHSQCERERINRSRRIGAAA